MYNSHGYNMVFYYGEEEEFWFLIMRGKYMLKIENNFLYRYKRFKRK